MRANLRDNPTLQLGINLPTFATRTQFNYLISQ